ncbi:hypothetical protein GPJ56_002288 [Histomonas meleagridis]|uniref:uncharacterized protein n=1 Tax=Histomonas meleagridis TaxID=135588 RepID=UPI003559A03F|nr:hypothetical protein GPJ56_002288 [Histomonas meleagridis]KAH0804550.1 hypothetical protein GO595_003380 [Histomonas meleagridis]
MFNRFRKIHAIIKLSFDHVSIGRNITSNFSLSYSRGNQNGTTKLMKPNEKGIINFNSSFEIKSTFYISKSDETPRPKLIQIKLHRYQKDQTPKIYGKIAIDASEHLSSVGPVTRDLEMESGRSIFPVLTLSITVNKISNTVDTSSDSSDGPSIDEELQKDSFSDWDQSSEISQNTASSSPPDSPKQKPQEIKRRHKSKVRRSPHRKNLGLPHSSSTDIKSIPLVVMDDEPLQNFSNICSESNGSTFSDEDIPELEESQFAQQMRLMSSIMTTDFKQKREVPFVCNNYEFPSSIFPIYGFILHSEFLSSKTLSTDFDEFLAEFITNYETSPFYTKITTENKFITTIILYSLIKSNPKKANQSTKYKTTFLERLLKIISKLSKEILSPFIRNFDILRNRFLSSKFEVDDLILDFQQLFSVVKISLQFPESINNFLINEFINDLDVKISNRILSNTNNFVFMKAILWNSFLSTLEQTDGIRFKHLREIVLVILMSPNISKAEDKVEMINGIAPDLDKQLVMYILQNIKPDELMPDAIDVESITKALENDLGKNKEKKQLEEQKLKSLDIPKNDIKLDLWNKVFVAETVRKFPFLRTYITREKQK